MSMEAFDTLAFAKKLKSAGYTEAQAEALVEAQAEVFRGMLDSTLTTKTEFKTGIHEVRSEIAAVRTELKGEIAELRTELKGEIAELRTELHKSLRIQTITMITAMVAIVGAFKLFG
ncbi:MAG: coiled-coil domain-containing protein [Lysobacterales bacterium]|jgi:ribosomal protein L29